MLCLKTHVMQNLPNDARILGGVAYPLQPSAKSVCDKIISNTSISIGSKMGLNLAVRHVCCQIPDLLLASTGMRI